MSEQEVERWTAIQEAELIALRKDAERHRFIRSVAVWRPNGANVVTWDVCMPVPDIRAGVLTERSVGDELDAAIDAAIAKEPT